MALIKLNNNSISAVTALPAGVGGSLVLLNTNSSDTDVASFNFDSTYINSTYDTYFIHGVIEAQTDNVHQNIRFSSGGSFETGGSDYGYEIQNLAGAIDENEAVSLIRMTRNETGNAAGENFNFSFYLYASQDSGQRTAVIGSSCYKMLDQNSLLATVFAGQRMTPKTNDGIQILPSSGNLQGTVSLYGVKT